MVAPADPHFHHFGSFYFFNQWLCPGPVHLQPFLMKKEKAFETVIVLAMASIIGFLIYDRNWLLYLALMLLALPLISMKASLALASIWFSFSAVLGKIMNFVWMFLCFYLILVPLAFLQKIFGKNQILRKREENTYFRSRNHLFTREDISKPW